MEKKNYKEILPSHEFCPGKLQIPTQKELEALNSMRKIKSRVREIKALLAELSQRHGPGAEEKAVELKRELDQLKRQWEKWEEKRKLAEKERMALLGYDTVD